MAADEVVVVPDARKSLPKLREEWSGCVKCSLGQDRIEREGNFVFGVGRTGGILFLGEGPGALEEKSGEPFVGPSGLLLRKVLERLGLREYYVTNAVSCRSAAVQVDASTGQPMLRKDWQTKHMVPVYKDEPPTPPQYTACRPRLLQEIYLVDPTVIVGLGGKAWEAITGGKTITITRDRGEARTVEIPGASWRPVLTDKKRDWARKVKGELVAPVEQNMVRYHFIPTLHPAYVLRYLSDQAPDSPFKQFVADLRLAIRVNATFQELVHGITPTVEEPAVDDDALQRVVQSDESE